MSGGTSLGPVSRKTRNFGLNIPRFDFPRWHEFLSQNFDAIDTLLSTVGLTSTKGVWSNSTQYLVGDRAIDTETSIIWRNTVQHISPATGTFEQYRASFPAHWEAMTNTLNFLGTYTGSVNYVPGDIVIYNDAYYQVVKQHVGGAFDPDNFALIMDMGELVDLKNELIAAIQQVSSGGFNPLDYYTKVAADARYALIADVYAKTETYSRTETDIRYKLDIKASGADFNTLTTPGEYYVAATGSSNTPDDGNLRPYFLKVVADARSGATIIKQEVHSIANAFEDDDFMFVRYYNAGWGSWVRGYILESVMDFRYKQRYIFHVVGLAVTTAAFGTSGTGAAATTVWTLATGLKFNPTAQLNVGNCYDGVSKFTAETPGWYEFYAAVPVNTAVTNSATVQLMKNGSTVLAQSSYALSAADVETGQMMHVNALVRLEIGDYVIVQLSAGGARFLAGSLTEARYYFGGKSVKTDY